MASCKFFKFAQEMAARRSSLRDIRRIGKVSSDYSTYTDKKENKIFPIYREIQMGSGAKSYMTKGFLIYEEMHKYFDHMRRSLVMHPIPLNFLIYEQNFMSWKKLEEEMVGKLDFIDGGGQTRGKNGQQLDCPKRRVNPQDFFFL